MLNIFKNSDLNKLVDYTLEQRRIGGAKEF